MPDTGTAWEGTDLYRSTKVGLWGEEERHDVSEGLYQTEKKTVLARARRVEAILSVTKALGCGLSAQELLDAILDHALRVTGAERGIVLLYNKQNKTLEKAALRGIEAERIGLPFSCENYRLSAGMIAIAQDSSDGLAVTQGGGAFPRISSEFKECGVQEALCVPLRARGQLLGIMYLDSSREGVFGEDALELMRAFAVLASVSVENADLRDKEAELQRMLSELPVIASC